MILNLYRSNQPVIAFSFPVLALIPAWLGLQNSDVIIQSWPTALSGLSAVFNAHLAVIFISNWLAISIGALLTNRIFNRFDFLSEASHLPGFFYVFIMCISRGLDPGILWGLVFFALAVTKLLTIPQSKKVITLALDAGLFLGIATLLHPLFILSGLMFPLTTFVGRKAGLREIVMPLFGTAFILWLFFGFTFIFFPENLDQFKNIASINILKQRIDSSTLLLAAFSLVLCFPFLNSYASSTNKSRSEKTIFLITSFGLAFCIIVSILIPSGHWQSAFAFPSAIFFSFFFQIKTRKNLLKSAFFYLFCLLLILSKFHGF